MLRLYMDVHVKAAITAGVRTRDIDVLTAQEDGAERLDDTRLLERATALNRVLFSQDDDLLAIARHKQAGGDVFSGLIYAHQLWEGHMKGREYHRVVMYCARGDFRNCIGEATRQAFKDVDDAYGEIVYPLIEQGVEEGLFPRKPTPLLLFGASAAMKGAIMMAWGSCSSDLDLKPELEELTNFILAGLVYQDRRF